MQTHIRNQLAKKKSRKACSQRLLSIVGTTSTLGGQLSKGPRWFFYTLIFIFSYLLLCLQRALTHSQYEISYFNVKMGKKNHIKNNIL